MARRGTEPPAGFVPSSGDLFVAAIGATVAALLLVALRFQDEWSGGALAVLTGVPCLAMAALGMRGGRPADGSEPRRSALLVSALVLMAATLFPVVDLLTDDESAEDGIVWAAGAFTVVAAILGVRYRSATCTLLAAFGIGAVTLAFVAEVLKPEGERPYHVAFTAYAGTLLAAGYVLRSAGDRRHSTQLVNAAGVALVVFAWVVGSILIVDDESDGGLDPGIEREWEAALVAGSLLTLLFGLLFRERGPGWTGAVAMALAIVAVGGEGDDTPTLVGWPLFLLAAALALTVAAIARRRTSRH